MVIIGYAFSRHDSSYKMDSTSQVQFMCMSANVSLCSNDPVKGKNSSLLNLTMSKNKNDLTVLPLIAEIITWIEIPDKCF